MITKSSCGAENTVLLVFGNESNPLGIFQYIHMYSKHVHIICMPLPMPDKYVYEEYPIYKTKIQLDIYWSISSPFGGVVATYGRNQG